MLYREFGRLSNEFQRMRRPQKTMINLLTLQEIILFCPVFYNHKHIIITITTTTTTNNNDFHKCLTIFISTRIHTIHI